MGRPATTNEATREDAMLGATEFTSIGNVLMGVMAIGGVCAMLYAVGSAMTDMPSREWEPVEQAEAPRGEFKKAA